MELLSEGCQKCAEKGVVLHCGEATTHPLQAALPEVAFATLWRRIIPVPTFLYLEMHSLNVEMLYVKWEWAKTRITMSAMPRSASGG